MIKRFVVGISFNNISYPKISSAIKQGTLYFK